MVALQIDILADNIMVQINTNLISIEYKNLILVYLHIFPSSYAVIVI